MGRQSLDLHPDKPEKPVFHVAPRQGWLNDPNGPFVFNGKYHLFYQHLTQGCEWGFGLVWAHVVSSDLVNWEHLPTALAPTPSSLDMDGCFSGCACVDTDGTPTILYTGVRLRSNPESHPLPPAECDLQLPFIESQIAAVADPDDPHLVHWRKDEQPFLAMPPPSMNLTGWRDPFVLERPSPSNNHEWVVLIGSGIKDMGGTALVYRTPSLRDPSSWRYDGLLCCGDGDTGAVWECPLVAQLRPLPPSHSRLPSHTLGLGQRRHSFQRLSPVSEDSVIGSSGKGDGIGGRKSGDWSGPATPTFGAANGLSADYDERYSWFYTISPDACTNASIYWLGHYSGGRYDIENARGPVRLDLGDVLYAPNVFVDDRGRTLLWGWLQERRSVGTYDYAGCMTVPRVMYLDEGRLWQGPVPEIDELRCGEAWHESELLVTPDQPVGIPTVGGLFLDLELTWRQGTAPAIGVLLQSWNASGEGGAAVLYNWESGALEVVFEALDPATMEFSLTAPTARRIGGDVVGLKPGQPLQLRLLLDYSTLEVFTGTGQVLSTRVYRGTPPPDSGAGIELVALDGTATLSRAAAYEMRTIWKETTAAATTAAAREASRASSVVGSPKSVQSLSTPQSPMGISPRDKRVLSFGQLSRAAELVGESYDLLHKERAALPPEEEMTADIFDDLFN